MVTVPIDGQVRVPPFCHEGETDNFPPQSLTTSLHRLGINMRYLGDIAVQAKKDMPFLTTICVLEMVARAAKHIFNATLKVRRSDHER